MMGVAGNVASGMVAGCAGEGRIYGADRDDYAAAAVAVLPQPDQAGQVYELAGDSGFTQTELAAEMSRLAGKEVASRDLSEIDYRALLEKFGLPAYVAEWLSVWDTPAKEGVLADDGGKLQLSKLIGRPTTPMAVTLARAYEQSKNPPAWKPNHSR
jgi:NAD(P)H dehydrogenase (quinone)